MATKISWDDLRSATVVQISLQRNLVPSYKEIYRKEHTYTYTLFNILEFHQPWPNNLDKWHEHKGKYYGGHCILSCFFADSISFYFKITVVKASCFHNLVPNLFHTLETSRWAGQSSLWTYLGSHNYNICTPNFCWPLLYSALLFVKKQDLFLGREQFAPCTPHV